MASIDRDREHAEALLVALLRALPRGAEIVVHPEGQRRPHRLQYPPPADLFAADHLGERAPDPARDSTQETARDREVATLPRRGTAPRETTPPASDLARDFARFSWPGVEGIFLLNTRQGTVVRLLHEALTDGCPEVRESVLLEAARKAGSDVIKLQHLFRHTRAWGTLIVPGRQGGTYRLPPLPEEF